MSYFGTLRTILCNSNETKIKYGSQNTRVLLIVYLSWFRPVLSTFKKTVYGYQLWVQKYGETFSTDFSSYVLIGCLGSINKQGVAGTGRSELCSW